MSELSFDQLSLDPRGSGLLDVLQQQRRQNLLKVCVAQKIFSWSLVTSTTFCEGGKPFPAWRASASSAAACDIQSNGGSFPEWRDVHGSDLRVQFHRKVFLILILDMSLGTWKCSFTVLSSFILIRVSNASTCSANWFKVLTANWVILCNWWLSYSM